MSSLNDLDAQIAALEAGSDPESEDPTDASEDESDEEQIEEAPKVDAPKPVARKPKSVAKDEPEVDPSKPVVKKFKSVCFRYLAGNCNAGDACLFRHRELNELKESDKLELVLSSRKRPNPDIGKVIKMVQIPMCKDFQKFGSCAKDFQCRFLHIATAGDAKACGLDFFCVPCKKGFTSAEQLEEHEGGRIHKEMLARSGDGGDGKGKGKGKGGEKGKGKGKGGEKGKGKGKGGEKGKGKGGKAKGSKGKGKGSQPLEQSDLSESRQAGTKRTQADDTSIDLPKKKKKKDKNVEMAESSGIVEAIKQKESDVCDEQEVPRKKKKKHDGDDGEVKKSKKSKVVDQELTGEEVVKKKKKSKKSDKQRCDE